MTSTNPISGAPLSTLGGGLNQYITQGLSLSDTLSFNFDRNLPVSHSISLSDSLSLNTVLNLSVDHTIGISDSNITNVIYNLELSDSIGISDSLLLNLVSRTSPSHSLSLSHTVGLNVIRQVNFADTLTLSDLVYRPISVNITHTLNLTHLALKIDPEVSIVHSLSLSQSAQSYGVFNKALSSTLTLSHSIKRIIPMLITQSLSLSHLEQERLLPQMNIVQSLSFVHGLDYLLNTETELAQNLNLNHSVVISLLPQQNVINTLNLSHVLDMTNFRVQNVVSDLVLVQQTDYSLFQQQNIAHQIVFGHTLDYSNFELQGNNQSLSLGHSVSFTLVKAGNYDAVSTMKLTHSVTLNRVINISICQCLELSDRVYKAIPVSVSHSLNLNDGIGFDQPVSNLELSHSVETNAVYDPCCGHSFIQDKFTKNTLVLTHGLNLNRVINVRVEQSLNLQQTAVYFNF